MNWKEWTHCVINKRGETVFWGPYDACLSFLLAARGVKFGWSLKKDQSHA